MNINHLSTDLSKINSAWPFKESLKDEERSWLSTAVEKIKQNSQGIPLDRLLLMQVQKLQSFSVMEVIRLVQLLRENLVELGKEEKHAAYLAHQAAFQAIQVKEDGKLSQYINHFGIDPSTLEGQKTLIRVAIQAATYDGWRTSQYISNYSIDKTTPEGMDALIQIAKLAAQEDGWGTSQYIQNYGIDPSKR